MPEFMQTIEWFTDPLKFLVNKAGELGLELLVLSLWIPYLIELLDRRKYRNSRRLIFQFLVRNVATKFNAYHKIVDSLADRSDFAAATREYLKAVEMRTLTDRYIETLSFALDENFATAMPFLVRRRERRLRMIILHAHGNQLTGSESVVQPQDELYRSQISLSAVADTMTKWAKELAGPMTELERDLKRQGCNPAVPLATYALIDELKNSKNVRELANNMIKLADRTGEKLRAFETQLAASVSAVQ